MISYISLERYWKALHFPWKIIFEKFENEEEKWRWKKWTFYPVMLRLSFLVQRTFEPCWLQIYNYFWHIYFTFLIIALERCLLDPERPCFLLFFEPNEEPLNAHISKSKVYMRKIIIYLKSAKFKDSLYQMKVSALLDKKFIFFIFIFLLHFQIFQNLFCLSISFQWYITYH